MQDSLDVINRNCVFRWKKCQKALSSHYFRFKMRKYCKIFSAKRRLKSIGRGHLKQGRIYCTKICPRPLQATLPLSHPLNLTWLLPPGSDWLLQTRVPGTPRGHAHPPPPFPRCFYRFVLPTNEFRRYFEFSEWELSLSLPA